MTRELRILMVAAENDGLLDGKVGGIGDVVRDVPPALAALSDPICQVGVVVPSYGFLHKRSKATLLCAYEFSFSGARERIELYDVQGRTPLPRVTHFVLDHPAFEHVDITTGEQRIFCDDRDAPFATDATKFARFCAAVAEGIRLELFGAITHLHLHDWHAAFLLVQKRFDKRCSYLRGLRTIYTIHNLALQGIRPLDGHASSLRAWHPNLLLSACEKIELGDPDYDDCLNPMAVGIRFADAVHVVSPSYKEEILRPSIPRRSDPDCVFYGGEGLERDLQAADEDGRLNGILNGCNYDSRAMPPRDGASYAQLLALLSDAVSKWSAKIPSPRHDLALARLNALRRAETTRPATILTAVTRVVSQKVRLMRLPFHAPALEVLLAGLADDEIFIILGTGDVKLEQFMFRVSCRFKNFLFLNGYDTPCADALYANGDLFLMPSSFEPCGISQMLAMRDGQPCVVHGVGGLKDTVVDGRTGFSFAADDLNTQTEKFVRTVFRAIQLHRNEPTRFNDIREAAFRERFLWSTAMGDYVAKLYA